MPHERVTSRDSVFVSASRYGCGGVCYKEFPEVILVVVCMHWRRDEDDVQAFTHQCPADATLSGRLERDVVPQIPELLLVPLQGAPRQDLVINERRDRQRLEQRAQLVVVGHADEDRVAADVLHQPVHLCIGIYFLV